MIIQDYDDIEDYDDNAVAQAYLSPLLLAGRKFDLRIYVLMTSCDPLRAYIFKEGMVRFCTQDYVAPNSANLDESYTHLTNFSLNKNNPSFDFAQNKKSLTAVLDELTSSGIDAEKVMDGIDRIIRLTLIAAQPVLASSYHTGVSLNDGKSRCFEILGFDILLDENASPWLLEVNCMPSLANYSPFDAELKKGVILGTLKVLDLDPQFKRKCVNHFKTLSAQGNANCDPVFDPARESEIAAATDWRQLLPIVDNPELSKTCEKALVAARDFGAPKRSTGKRDENQKSKAQKEKDSKRDARRQPPPDKAKTRVMQKVDLTRPKLSRAVILANDARAAKFDTVEKSSFGAEKNCIFDVFDPSQRHCVINEIEERERIAALRRQIQIGAVIAIPQEVKLIFLAGKSGHVRGDIPPADRREFSSKPSLRHGHMMATAVNARMREALERWASA
jgi:tubulin polyglutamylase TTLL6/13